MLEDASEADAASAAEQNDVQMPDAAAAAETSSTAAWSLTKRIAFRFAFTYLLLYNLPFPFSWVPVKTIWQPAVTFISTSLLGIHYLPDNESHGSGDRLYDYILILTFLIAASAITLVWSIVDGKRKSYPHLDAWLRTYIRIVIAATMMTYGSCKIIPTQFPTPNLITLLSTYGQASPMNLMWTFMGYSPGYTAFAGFAELLAGALLVIPRLTAIGSLVCLAVMTNVFILNLCYDVPVKIFSFHLLLMSCYLLAPDAGRLYKFFFRHRADRLSEPAPLFKNPLHNKIALACQIVFVCYFASQHLGAAIKLDSKMAAARKAPFYGIWWVDEFTLDGKAHQPLITDTERWKRAVFDSPDLFVIETMDGAREYFRVEVKTDKKSFELYRYRDPDIKFKFSLAPQSDADEVNIDGRLDEHTIQAKMHRTDESKMLLNARGFHWVNEYPYNMSKLNEFGLQAESNVRPITVKSSINLDFEEDLKAGAGSSKDDGASILPSGWKQGGADANDYQMTWQRIGGHQNSACAVIKSKSEHPKGFATLMQGIDATPLRGKRLRLSCYVKAVDVKDFAGLWMRMDSAKQGGICFDNMHDRPINGTKDWHQVECILDVPETTTSISYGILLQGPGQIIFDDLAFNEVSADTPTTDLK